MPVPEVPWAEALVFVRCVWRMFMPKFLAWRDPSRYLSILKKGDFEKETLRKALVQAGAGQRGHFVEVCG